MGKLKINVSGQLFVTTQETLSKYPHTKLGQLAMEDESEFFFDADEEVFREVLRYHRTGELHLPRNMCYQMFSRQLLYWGVSESVIQDCCQNEDPTDGEMEKQFQWFEKRIELKRELRWRDHIWYFLTDPTGPYTRYKKAAIIWAVIYSLFVIIQSINSASITTPSAARRILGYKNATYVDYMKMKHSNPCLAISRQVEIYAENKWLKLRLQYTSSVFFIVEICCRFICCPRKKDFFGRVNTMDLTTGIAELLQYIMLLILMLKRDDLSTSTNAICMSLITLESLMLAAVQLRAVRLLMFATMCSQLRVLLLAIYSSKKEIALLIAVLGISCLICGPAIFYSEIIGTYFTESSEIIITDIPTAYWWVVVTMTTVGYGDYYPTTGAGYVMAAILIMIGMMLTALPIAIIGTNFTIYYEYNARRNRRQRMRTTGSPQSTLRDNSSPTGSGLDGELSPLKKESSTELTDDQRYTCI